MAESNSNAELIDNVSSHRDNIDFSNLESKGDDTESMSEGSSHASDNFTATNLTFSIQLIGLAAGTQYYYQVEAMNTLPNTSRSAEQNFTTRELRECVS